MTPTARVGGHPVSWDGECWRYDDTGEPVPLRASYMPRPCRHCGRTEVFVDAIGGFSGEEGYTATVPVDACIADVVAALNVAGIATVGACCGHGEDGSILLADGRELGVYRSWRHLAEGGEA